MAQTIILLPLLLCLLCTTTVLGSDHVATFNIKAVSGQVYFTNNNQPNQTGVRIQIGELKGLSNGQAYNWSVRALPMLYDRVDPCSDEYVGPIFRNLDNSVGPLTNFTGAVFTDSTLALEGADSISGRALVIEITNTTRYCASILPVGEVITAVAQFGTPLAGTVTFRQRADDPNSDTSIYVDLFDVTEPIAAEMYDWLLSDNNGITNDMTVEEWCMETADDPFAAVGDLTSKFGSVDVKTVHTRQRYYYIDPNITLSGANSIVDKSLVFTLKTVGNEGNKAACSPVRMLRSKTVDAQFSGANVTGSIVFSQTSPWEATSIRINLYNLRGLAGGYHVHKFPVPQRILPSDFPGSADNVGGHFNPYNIDVTSDPDFPNGTNDEYEVGDISGKFGSLANLQEYHANYTDWNLPLFGSNSIVGRSFIIHLTNGARWVYGRISYPTPVKTVKTVFTYPLVGQITMKQDRDDPYSDTSIFVELAHADGSDTTYDHEWHVHVNKIGDDHLDQTGRCSSTAGHFNPFNVKLTEEYATECSIAVTRRCEIGDFSKKYGRITVPASVRTQVGKYFFTDVQLPLTGAYTVDDRSVVVHLPNAAPERLGCGDSLEVATFTANARMWTEGPVSGSIELSQDSEFDPVYINADLTGLDGIVGPWHIHVLPVPYNADDPCSGTSVQGHFNPFEVLGSPPDSTVDYYEAGDFSGKFGFFNDLQEISATYVDPSISLFGARSVAGRSMVVHLSSDGSRYRCATLEPILSSGDFQIVARANISTNTFSGYMILTQTRFENGRLSDTTIEAQFAPTDTSQNDVYFWTIRSGDVTSGVCDNRDMTFNPNTVDTEGAYSTQCSIATQLRCQVGDLTNKIGNYSSMYGRTLRTDTNLPLTGSAGVIGLPLYMVTSSGTTVGCTTVLPLPTTGVDTTLIFRQMIDFDVYDFKLQMAQYLTDVEPWQIIAPHYPVNNDTYTMCATIQLWIIGDNAAAARDELVMKSVNDELGIYSQTETCRTVTGDAHQIRPTSILCLMFVAALSCIWHCIIAS